MKAPDWYRNAAGPGGLKPPPPGLADKPPPAAPAASDLRQAGQGAAAGGSASPSLPALPAAPQGGSPGSALPLPPPPALPAPPGTAGGGGSVALALTDGRAPPAVPKGSARAPPGRPAALVDAAPSRTRSAVEQKSFVIPGLQSRPYTDEELMLAFEMIDLDRHNTIGPTELLRALTLSGEDATTDTEVTEMIRLFDPDGSGTVEYDEFVKAFQNPPALFRNFDLQRRETLASDAAPPSRAGSRGPAQSSLAALPPPRRPSLSVSESGSGSAPPRKRSTSTQPPPRRPDRRPEAIATIMGGKPLKPQFIKQIYQRFVEIDMNDQGLVSYGAFCLVLRRAQSDAMRKAFDAFDTDQNLELDLRGFVVSLSMFTKSRTEDKFRFAFMMFDEEQRGTLSQNELGELLKAVIPHAPAHERDVHVSRIYAMHNQHPNARISLNEVQMYALEHEEELVPAGFEVGAGGEA